MILITGATGFIGRHVIERLHSQALPARCLVRTDSRARELERLGCTLALGDMTDRRSLREACAGADAVIHLVAVIRGSRSDFEQVMEGGTRSLIEAASAAGVGRFVLVSALGLDRSTRELTHYYRAKWNEEVALEESGLSYVVFRPSFVFGGDGGVLPTFLRLVRYSPVTPVLGTGTQLIQPIAVEDVAGYLVKALELGEAGGRVFDLAGPDRVSWNDLYALIARVLGRRRAHVHIPMPLARGAAALFERVPGFPFTRDQLKMIEAGDNTADIEPLRQAFNLPLMPLEEQIRRAAR